MVWLYEQQQISELPEDCVGFVYLITNNISGRKYIGKKFEDQWQREVQLC